MDYVFNFTANPNRRLLNSLAIKGVFIFISLCALWLTTAHTWAQDVAPKVSVVNIFGVLNSEKVELQKSLTLQPGAVFDEKQLSKDQENLEEAIHKRGYPNATVTSFRLRKLRDKSLSITYRVQKDIPCLIDQITVENSKKNILNFISLPVETGTLCDLHLLEEKMEELKNTYLESGYLSAQAQLKTIVYSPLKDRAKLILTIEKGPKTNIELRDEKQKFLNFDFLNPNDRPLSYSDLLLASDTELKESLKIYYQKKGYPYVFVQGPKRLNEKNGDHKVSFLVEKGPFVKITDVIFIGEYPKKRGVLLKELGLSPKILSQGIPFVQSSMSIYKAKMKDIFFRDGFLDATIPDPDFNFSIDGESATLIFNCSLGEQYVVSKIDVQNLPQNMNLNSKNLGKILKENDILNDKKKQAYTEEVKSQLLDAGYLYATVKADYNLQKRIDKRKINNLVVEVSPGPLVKIGRVLVRGDNLEKTETIVRLSGLQTGGIVSQQIFEKAHNSLMRHGLFASIIVEPLNPHDVENKKDVLNIVIRARAKTGYQLTLSPGWGDFKGYRFNLDYSLNKITRHGLRLLSNASVSQEKQQSNFASTDTTQILGQQLNVGVTEPLFKLGSLQTPLDLTALVGYQVIAETLTNREYQTLKLVSEWKPTFFDTNWLLETTLIHEKSTATSSENAVIETIDSPSIVVREILNQLSFDSRNQISWPTQGMLASLGFGAARFGFSSGVQYNRYLPKMDVYFPLADKFSGAVLMGGTFVSDTKNHKGDTVTPPASRRATLSDNALIRGFPDSYGGAFAQPGPLLWIHYVPNTGAQNCDTTLASIGATNLLYVKSEGRYRVNEFFGLVGFLDTGTSYLTPKEIAQINQEIQRKIANATATAGQCVVDNAAVIGSSPQYTATNIVGEYWRQAYVSTGVGMRVILGNIASVSLDYGYPLKDPQNGCTSPADALSASTPPTCISRIQNSTYSVGHTTLKFKGAMHLGIGAAF